MKKYIEAIIEIVLDNVSCLHHVEEEYPRGPKQDEVNYGLVNERDVIKKCLLIKPEAYHVADKEELIEKHARAMHDEHFGKTTSCKYQCSMMQSLRKHMKKILEAK